MMANMLYYQLMLLKKYSNVTITFESNGGTKVSPQTIEKNSKSFSSY